MKLQIKNENLSWKSLTTLFLIVCSWFYINVCFGYFLSKLFYNVCDTINENSFYETIKFRKKFNLRNLKNFVINYILKTFKDWIKRMGDKWLIFFKSLSMIIEALKIKIYKNEFESVKFWESIQIFASLVWHSCQVFGSVLNEMFCIHNIVKLVIKCKQFILLLMSEYMLMTRIIYIFYFIFLGLFGLSIGFLLGMYKRDQDIYIFTLLFLLEMIYNNGLDYILLKPDKVEKFSTFSLNVVEEINKRPLKIIFKQPDKVSKIPLPILTDPSISIEIDFIWKESENYKFELFKFYQNVDKKVKYEYPKKLPLPFKKVSN